MDHTEIVTALIPEKLRQIEEAEQVKILYCVESGSRAWGFPSPDSDYDVRFLYVRKPSFYLRLDRTRDVIEWQLDETLDINGWDIRKALLLLHGANPTLFEWNMSPIVYKMTEEWAPVSNLITDSFRKKPVLYHYLHMARRTIKEQLSGQSVRLKKYFYALRPLLACEWILTRATPPPMGFAELMHACLPSQLLPTVEAMLLQKATVSELGHGPRVPVLDAYLAQMLSAVQQQLTTLPTEAPPSWEPFQEIFVRLLSEV